VPRRAGSDPPLSSKSDLLRLDSWECVHRVSVPVRSSRFSPPPLFCISGFLSGVLVYLFFFLLAVVLFDPVFPLPTPPHRSSPSPSSPFSLLTPSSFPSSILPSSIPLLLSVLPLLPPFFAPLSPPSSSCSFPFSSSLHRFSSLFPLLPPSSPLIFTVTSFPSFFLSRFSPCWSNLLHSLLSPFPFSLRGQRRRERVAQCLTRRAYPRPLCGYQYPPSPSERGSCDT